MSAAPPLRKVLSRFGEARRRPNGRVARPGGPVGHCRVRPPDATKGSFNGRRRLLACCVELPSGECRNPGVAKRQRMCRRQAHKLNYLYQNASRRFVRLRRVAPVRAPRRRPAWFDKSKFEKSETNPSQGGLRRGRTHLLGALYPRHRRFLGVRRPLHGALFQKRQEDVSAAARVQPRSTGRLPPRRAAAPRTPFASAAS